MDRRWIRIDRGHRAFDCTPQEFDALLVAAHAERELSVGSRQSIGSSDSEAMSIEVDDFQLQEAINAELALLASMQRRERILKSEREQMEQTRAQMERVSSLVDLHAATLRRHGH